MCKRIHRLYKFFQRKIRKNIFFESIVGSIIGIVTISLSFALLAQTCPDTYRLLTKWANTPLKPVALDCTFEEKKINAAKSRDAKIYRVTITFDTEKVSNKEAIVYSPDQQFAIRDPNLSHDPQDCDYRKYLAIIPVEKGLLKFEVIGKINNMPQEKIEYKRCKNLKVQFIDD